MTTFTSPNLPAGTLQRDIDGPELPALPELTDSQEQSVFDSFTDANRADLCVALLDGDTAYLSKLAAQLRADLADKRESLR